MCGPSKAATVCDVIRVTKISLCRLRSVLVLQLVYIEMGDNNFTGMLPSSWSALSNVRFNHRHMHICHRLRSMCVCQPCTTNRYCSQLPARCLKMLVKYSSSQKWSQMFVLLLSLRCITVHPLSACVSCIGNVVALTPQTLLTMQLELMNLSRNSLGGPLPSSWSNLTRAS